MIKKMYTPDLKMKQRRLLFSEILGMAVQCTVYSVPAVMDKSFSSSKRSEMGFLSSRMGITNPSGSWTDTSGLTCWECTSGVEDDDALGWSAVLSISVSVWSWDFGCTGFIFLPILSSFRSSNKTVLSSMWIRLNPKRMIQTTKNLYEIFFEKYKTNITI